MNAASQQPPVVSVLMTVRDAATYLDKAIDSIRSQTMSDWELVIVDDASNDETVSIIERFGGMDPRIHLIRRSASGGPYAAANEGLRHVRGHFVARMDGDDVSLPDRLERQVRFLRERPALRACAADVLLLNEGRTAPLHVRGTPTLPGAIKWGTCVRGYLQPTALLEAAALREIGGYRELPAGQDHRLWCELSRRGWLGVLPEVVLLYRQHAGQISRTIVDRQQSLIVDAIRDHLFALTGELWKAEDVQHLRALGRDPVYWRTGMSLIRRFERLWRSDVGLSGEEQRELALLTRWLRVEHAREVTRRLLSGSPPGRALLRAYTRLGGSSR